MNARKLAALALMIAAPPISAADVSECVKISDDVVRLFCYDHAAGRAQAAPEAAAAPAVEAAKPAPEPEKKAKTEKRVEARIVGRFQGWSPGTVFKLDNGQTWKAIGAGTHYSTADSPKVVIERDFVGQNLMSVEGVKSQAIVQRVED